MNKHNKIRLLIERAQEDLGAAAHLLQEGHNEIAASRMYYARVALVPTPHSGQTQPSGRSLKAVPCSTPLSGIALQTGFPAPVTKKLKAARTAGGGVVRT